MVSIKTHLTALFVEYISLLKEGGGSIQHTQEMAYTEIAERHEVLSHVQDYH